MSQMAGGLVYTQMGLVVEQAKRIVIIVCLMSFYRVYINTHNTHEELPLRQKA